MATREKEYHVSNMKEFLYDPLLVDPVDVARRDRMEQEIMEVQQIL